MQRFSNPFFPQWRHKVKDFHLFLVFSMKVFLCSHAKYLKFIKNSKEKKVFVRKKIIIWKVAGRWKFIIVKLYNMKGNPLKALFPIPHKSWFYFSDKKLNLLLLGLAFWKSLNTLYQQLFMQERERIYKLFIAS